MTLELRGWNDQPSWDAFVGSQVNGHVNQGWAWGELAGPLGGRTHRYAVVEDGSIRAAISVISNPIHRIGRRQLFLSRGPAVDNPTPQIFGLIDEALRSAAARENAIVAKVEPFVAAGDRVWQNLLRDSGFTPLYPSSQPRSIWALDLQPDLDDLLAAMKPKWRYNIRLAAKRGVEIIGATDAEFDDFYRLYVETARRDHFYIHNAPLYRTIFRAFWDLGQFELLIARYQGEPIAAVTLVHIGRTAWYMHGASTTKHRDVMAPHLLQWEAIQWAKTRGALLYDFRGVPDVPARDQDMNGVYRFKQGFGGRHITMLEQYAKGYQTPLYQLWRGYWRGRFVAQEARRMRAGEPHRQWA